MFLNISWAYFSFGSFFDFFSRIYDTPIDIERYDITYNSAFGQVPVAHNYHNGYGLLVFENNDEALYDGLKKIIECPKILEELKNNIINTDYGNVHEIKAFDKLVRDLM